MCKIILPADDMLLDPKLYLFVWKYLRSLPYSQRGKMEYLSFNLYGFEGELLNRDKTRYMPDLDDVLYHRYIGNMCRVADDGVSPRYYPRLWERVKPVTASYLIDLRKPKNQRH